MAGVPHFEIFPADDGYRWPLVADNGELVAQSEGYRDAHDAERGAMDAARAARDAVTEHRRPGSGEVTGLSIDARQVDG
jgi:uncharacterized protein YegP (UPF0339 family)